MCSAGVTLELGDDEHIQSKYMRRLRQSRNPEIQLFLFTWTVPIPIKDGDDVCKYTVSSGANYDCRYY